MYQEIIAGGKTEGKANALITYLSKVLQPKLPAKLTERILAEHDLQVLDEWFEIAITAESYQDFRKKTGL